MGGMVRAACRCCDYGQLMLFGLGFETFRLKKEADERGEAFFDCFAFYCVDCFSLNDCHGHEIVGGCYECGGRLVPPGSPEFCARVGQPVDMHHEIAEGVKDVLTDGEYLCPSCRQFSLYFEDAGEWD